jgi:hypothetical protein
MFNMQNHNLRDGNSHPAGQIRNCKKSKIILVAHTSNPSYAEGIGRMIVVQSQCWVQTPVSLQKIN